MNIISGRDLKKSSLPSLQLSGKVTQIYSINWNFTFVDRKNIHDTLTSKFSAFSTVEFVHNTLCQNDIKCPSKQEGITSALQ